MGKTEIHKICHKNLLLMEENSLPKVLVNYELDGHRGTGRFETKWKDKFN
jgi:hypothetical protein